MIRRTGKALISLGDVPKGSRKIPDPKMPDPSATHDPQLARPAAHAVLGDLNVGGLKYGTLAGLRTAPRRYYVNKFTAFFFQELDKGTRSPWVVGAWLLCAFFACKKVYFLANGYAYEEREYHASVNPSRGVVSNIKFKESHNLAVGLVNRGGESRGNGGSFPSNELAEEVSPESVMPPRLIHTEKSEAQATREEDIPADMVVVERREYDRTALRDKVYRMVQYIYADDVAEKADDAKALRKEDRDIVAFEKKKREWLNSLPLRKRQDRARSDHVHAIVKCTALDSNNNCVPEIGDAQSESTRKILLGLGPTHILRDPSKTFTQHRMTVMKMLDVDILLMGIRGAEIPNAIRQFSNFKIDIIEKDGSLIRLARNFLGFKEPSGQTVTLADPLHFTRKLAAEPGHKRYDFVIIDALDGKGRLSPSYSKLEFIDSVRNIMSPAGVVAVNLPNDDAQYYYQCLQNWRLAFENKLFILAHCQTTQNTILFTFQDDSGRGKPVMGSGGTPQEFSHLVKSFLTSYENGQTRFSFDLIGEINPKFFNIVASGEKIDLASSLPPNHPIFRDKKYFEKVCSSVGSPATSFDSSINTAGLSRIEKGTLSPVESRFGESNKEY